MNILLVAKQGNHGGIAPTPKFKGSRSAPPCQPPTYTITVAPYM
jgi:hypothetical protein